MKKMDLYSGAKEKLKGTGRENTPGKDGKKFIKIDWEQVKRAAHMQCTMEEVAGLLGISHDTLERACMQEQGKPYKELFKEWSDGGRCSLRRKQWLLADKNAAMAIFLGKQLLGQKDDFGLNHTGNQKMEVVQYGDKPMGQWKEDKSEETEREPENTSI